MWYRKFWNKLASSFQSKSPPKENMMQVFSKEHLDQLLDEVKLLNTTLRFIEQNRTVLMMEYGIQTMQATVADLKLQRAVLTMKSEALHAYLTE